MHIMLKEFYACQYIMALPGKLVVLHSSIHLTTEVLINMCVEDAEIDNNHL